ncbi:sodium-dependent excitatory amino acid transporter glt-6, putative [Babesia caballi]|uniref:Sodium-dependent excitatory amino acid transporter glt-6, putative n=1 Tax=Babesia caballi TaxID=5871 RepID=A0AAV4LNB0_BABCB|nr:sodium-dependent excitatory amino acid transporter glt-6, putative [Babesia caballi]
MSIRARLEHVDARGKGWSGMYAGEQRGTVTADIPDKGRARFPGDKVVDVLEVLRAATAMFGHAAEVRAVTVLEPGGEPREDCGGVFSTRGLTGPPVLKYFSSTRRRSQNSPIVVLRVGLTLMTNDSSSMRAPRGRRTAPARSRRPRRSSWFWKGLGRGQRNVRQGLVVLRAQDVVQQQGVEVVGARVGHRQLVGLLGGLGAAPLGSQAAELVDGGLVLPAELAVQVGLGVHMAALDAVELLLSGGRRCGDCGHW